MATKLVFVSLLVLQLTTTVFSKHGRHRKQPVAYEPGGPAGGIPCQSGGPAGGIPGGPVGGVPNQTGGPAQGIPAPGVSSRNVKGGDNRKKWCIGKKEIKKGLLKSAFEELCKEVDCSATGPTGICYDESIWSKASYAMNLRFQNNGQKDFDCDLDGRAEITTSDPSWGECTFISS